MKYYLFIFIMLIYKLNVNAQATSDIGKIALSVIMPDNIDGLDVSQLSKIETKISQIVTATGIAASGYNNNFVMYPKFAIYETSIVEGGMQNITIVNCDLSLFIKQVDNNILFATTNKQVKGSGANKSLALTNAISKITINDQQFKDFIDQGKSKIKNYYESKCNDIIVKSESLIKMQDFEQALAVLMSVPEEVSCFNKIQTKSIEAYKVYQNHKCAEQIQQAKTELSLNNYSNSLRILSEIDPSSKCYNESQNLISRASNKVDIEEKKQWDLKMKMYQDNVSIEKMRINAIKEVAVSYYKSKPTNVSYTYLIK